MVLSLTICGTAPLVRGAPVLGQHAGQCNTWSDPSATAWTTGSKKCSCSRLQASAGLGTFDAGRRLLARRIGPIVHRRIRRNWVGALECHELLPQRSANQVTEANARQLPENKGNEGHFDDFGRVAANAKTRNDRYAERR